MDNVFKQRLMELRKDNNLNQRELARAIEVSQVAICKWEQGYSLPNIDVLYRLCRYFNVTSDYLLGLENDDGSRAIEYEFEYQHNNTHLKHKEKK